MRDIGASTRQFEKFRSLVFVGAPVEAALTQIGAPLHVQAFVAHTMMLAQSGSTEEVLAAFFYGREDIIPEMFSRLQKILPGARKTNDPLRHFVYYIERHIEPQGERYARIEPLRPGQTVRLVALPEVELAVSDLLPRS